MDIPFPQVSVHAKIETLISVYLCKSAVLLDCLRLSYFYRHPPFVHKLNFAGRHCYFKKALNSSVPHGQFLPIPVLFIIVIC